MSHRQVLYVLLSKVLMLGHLSQFYTKDIFELNPYM